MAGGRDAMAMRPYVIRQGDHMRKLAVQHGFNAAAVWSDPQNARLSQQRASMDILYPGDVLLIPEPIREWWPVELGQVNRFVASIETVPIQTVICHRGALLANASYRVRELPELGELSTDARGCVRFESPATLAAATLDFEEPPLRLVLQIGHLDPADTSSGLRQRLFHLGHLPTTAAPERDVRAAIAMFQLTRVGLEANGEVTPETRQAITEEHGS